MRILVIEDSEEILTNVMDYLELKGYIVDCSTDGAQGFALASQNNYDLIVLDIMLPNMYGFDICRRLREEARINTPILMLTALDALPDRLLGLNSGADDYLVKPFALSELLARIEAILRRAHGNNKLTLQVADLIYDLDRLEITRAGQPIKLNPTGMKILATLMQRSPSVVKRDVLEQAVWGDELPDSDSLRSHIHQLRQAIDKPYELTLLHNIHGVGYKLSEK